jgi:Na+/H+ antiporter NhaD/arsenite permease-like protein
LSAILLASSVPHAAGIAIVILTLVAVAAGRVPLLRMNRATIALTGGTALVLVGALPLASAFAAIDLGTIALLLALMAVNVTLREAGFFRLMAAKIVARARSPKVLLAGVIAVSGALSAVLLNDTICLMLTPFVLDLALALRRNPIPYLMGLATASNIGSAATIIGNPQNILIGAASGIPFGEFTAALAGPAAGGLVIAWIVLVALYREEFASGRFLEQPAIPAQTDRPLLIQSVAAVLVMVAACLMGWPAPLAALAAGALVLVNRRLDPDQVLAGIDWSLLVFFAGLFVVTGAVESLGLSERLFRVAAPLAERGVAPLSAVGLVLSNVISNVPAVMLFRPLIPGFADPRTAWLALAMSTTLAGNLTLLGSVANLIVAETAARRDVRLSFTEYLKAGVPITILSLALGVAWLTFAG